jgi:hypothetical protein
VVERIRESPEGVPCSGRAVAARFRQVKARFEYACMFLSNNYLQALEDKREGAATVDFDQRVSRCWRDPQRWFGEVSTNFELVR